MTRSMTKNAMANDNGAPVKKEIRLNKNKKSPIKKLVLREVQNIKKDDEPNRLDLNKKSPVKKLVLRKPTKKENNTPVVDSEYRQIPVIGDVKYLDIAVIRDCSPDYQKHEDLEYITREEYDRRGYTGIKKGEAVYWNTCSSGGYKDGYKVALCVRNLDCGGWGLKQKNLEQWEAINEIKDKDMWIVAPKGWHWEYCSEKAYFTFSWYELKPIEK